MTSVQASSPLLQESDKSFWHGYLDFYDEVLPASVDGTIVEFGVFHGNSIRWLLSRYPQARIAGVDILAVQPQWPVSDRVAYHRVDQSAEPEVAAFFQSIDAPGLIIEDGSHIPSHQARCLRLGMRHIRPGGSYVLEDIHSSHPAHELYLEEFGRLAAPRPGKHHPTVLSLLLCFEHLIRIGGTLQPEQIRQFAVPGFMSEPELVDLFRSIASIRVFKRATLPSRCYACNSSAFDYPDFRCACGVDLLKVADSMTVLIRAR